MERIEGGEVREERSRNGMRKCGVGEEMKRRKG